MVTVEMGGGRTLHWTGGQDQQDDQRGNGSGDQPAGGGVGWRDLAMRRELLVLSPGSRHCLSDYPFCPEIMKSPPPGTQTIF